MNEKGLTRYRKIVLEVLKEHPHSDAYEIHAYALQRDSRISLPTVYRALKYLKEKGYITEHRFNENHSHYEVSTDSVKKDQVHVHFICKKCGKIEDAGFTALRGLSKKADEKSFLVEESHLNLFGVCKDCQKK